MKSIVLVAVVLVAVVLVAMLGCWLWTPDKARALLEAKYANQPDDFVQVAGMRLHVRDSGPKTAPPVILLHGFGSSLHTWEAWAQGLAKDFRVIRLDLPGSALSGPDPAGNYADARTLQSLGALMDGLRIARASLVGNSIGGRIAWTFAVTNPSRVDQLVLVSPDGFASPGFEYGKPPEVPAVLQLMRYVLPRPVMRMNLAAAFADPASLTDGLLTRYHDLMLAPGVRGALLTRMRQTVLPDPVPLLRRIDAPTLLLWGDKDAMIPIANAQDYLRVLRNGRLVSLPGVGHVPQEEAPARSLEPVVAFLKR